MQQVGHVLLGLVDWDWLTCSCPDSSCGPIQSHEHTAVAMPLTMAFIAISIICGFMAPEAAKWAAPWWSTAVVAGGGEGACSYAGRDVSSMLMLDRASPPLPRQFLQKTDDATPNRLTAT